MASLTIRRLDDRLKAKLRARAARNGRSMSEEARLILTAALTTEPSPTPRLNLVELIRRRFEPLGGVDLDIPPRDPMRPPPDFT